MHYRLNRLLIELTSWKWRSLKAGLSSVKELIMIRLDYYQIVLLQVVNQDFMDYLYIVGRFVFAVG